MIEYKMDKRIEPPETPGNDFTENDDIDVRDREAVTLAQQGNRSALEELISRHQPLIYNIAFRMTGSRPDAEDVTQEIIIKVITNLAGFRGGSKFRTWLYRIVANHVINMKKKRREVLFSSFEKQAELIENIPDMDLPDSKNLPVEVDLMVEEAKMSCLSGMLLCLDRVQRLVFILGAVLGVDSTVGSEVLETSRVNYRKILSRARKQINNFMNERCGLIDKNNSCLCSRKTRAMIEAGYIDPKNLQFGKQYLDKINSLVKDNYHPKLNPLGSRCQDLFRDQGLQGSRDYTDEVRAILNCKELQEIIHFN